VRRPQCQAIVRTIANHSNVESSGLVFFDKRSFGFGGHPSKDDSVEDGAAEDVSRVISTPVSIKQGRKRTPCQRQTIRFGVGGTHSAALGDGRQKQWVKRTICIVNISP